MDHSVFATATGLLVLLLAGRTQLAASPIQHPINYGDWQLSDFIMNSPQDANRRVYKEAPQFLSHLNTKNDSSADSGITLNQILTDLRAADNAGSDVTASALHDDASTLPSKAALPPHPSQTMATHSVVFSSGNGIIPPPSKAAVTLHNDVTPPPFKPAVTLRNDIASPSKASVPPSTSQTMSTHTVVHSPSSDVDPPAVRAASPLPVHIGSVSGVIHTSGTYVDQSEASNYVDASSSLNDQYVASESIFVTSDVDGYDAPAVGAGNTAYSAVVSDDASGGQQYGQQAAVSDHLPSESMVVASELSSEPWHSAVDTPSPASLGEEFSPSHHSTDAVAPADNHVGATVNPAHPEVIVNHVYTTPETVPAQEETEAPANGVKPVTYTATSTSQLPARQTDAPKQTPSSNAVDRVPTFQKKPLPPPVVEPVPKSSSAKLVNNSPVKAIDETKYLSNTPRTTTTKLSSSVVAPKVVDTVKYVANALDKSKAVDTAKSSNTKQDSEKVNKTKSAPKALDTPKVVAKTKPADNKQVKETVDNTKTASNTLNMPKAADKSKPSNAVQATDKVDKTKSEISKAVDKTEPTSNVMKVPEKVAVTKSPSKVPENPENRDAFKSETPTNAGTPQESSGYEKAIEQKKRLLDKMLKWTQLLQSQERERQMEYAELVKEIQQLQHLEYQIYNQRPAYPYRRF